MSAEEKPPTYQVRRAADMPIPKPPTWLATGWVPNAEITVLVGEEGIGKSLSWVVLAMHVTRGIPLPELNLPQRAPRDVVLVLTEDSWGEVRARLETAGADLTRVYVFSEDADGSGSPVFPAQKEQLIRWAATAGVAPALVVVDAWLDTVPAGAAVRDTQSARVALAPWKEIAGKLQAAVLLVTHTNRLGTGNTRDLMGSTVALRQKARMVLFAAREPGDGESGGPHHVWIGPEKANTTGMRNAIRFAISIEQERPWTPDDPGTVATLIDPEDVGRTIADLVAEWRRDSDAEAAPAKHTAAEAAEHYVLTYMASRGVDTVLSTDVKAAAHKAGHGTRAVETAMKALGESKPIGPGQPWLYRLHQSPQPESMLSDSANTADTANTAKTGSGQTPQSAQSSHSAEAWVRVAETAGRPS